MNKQNKQKIESIVDKKILFWQSIFKETKDEHLRFIYAKVIQDLKEVRDYINQNK